MPASDATVQTYTLKHPGSCSGMFWRDDPRPDAKRVSGGNSAVPLPKPRKASILNPCHGTATRPLPTLNPKPLQASPIGPRTVQF
mmetsp:Transcript_15688/g.24363  ORF Transcript_15688/g.24363 Transcript_15688/m.24363 type:complete len:85 (+) Transcript_15688:172-426(+)